MGGTSTAVLDTFYAFYTPGANPRRVVGGLGWEVASRLTADGVAFERPNTYGAGTGVTYDAEALKVLWERLAEDAGVELLLHTWATGVRLDGDRRLGAVRLWNKGGERWVEAAAFVDASGDADVCAMAGAGYDDASSTPGGVQSLSTLFKLANVDLERATAVPKAELWALMRDAVEHGGYRLPRVEGSWHRTPYPGVVLIHMTRIPNVDATDPAQLTRAEVEGRRQVAGVPPLPARPGAGLRAVRGRRDVAGDRRAREPPGPRRPPPDARRRPRRPPVRRRDRPVRRPDRGSRRRRRHGVAVRGRVGRATASPTVPAAGRDRGAADGRTVLLGDPRRARFRALDGDLHGDGPGGRDGGGDGGGRGDDAARARGRRASAPASSPTARCWSRWPAGVPVA